MRKLNYLVLLISFLFLSCSEDSDSVSNENLFNFSIVGEWKTTSAVLNGVQKIGGTNRAQSELTLFEATGDLTTATCSNPTFSIDNVYAFSEGIWSANVATSTLTQIATAYDYPASNIIGTYNINCEVVKINATELVLKIRNYPNANDVYVKKYTRTQ